MKTISAIQALAKRHVPLAVAKHRIEEVMLGGGRIVTVDLPMLENAAAFESELLELGVHAMRDVTAAAAEG